MAKPLSETLESKGPVCEGLAGQRLVLPKNKVAPQPSRGGHGEREIGREN